MSSAPTRTPQRNQRKEETPDRLEEAQKSLAQMMDEMAPFIDNPKREDVREEGSWHDARTPEAFTRSPADT